MPEEATGIEPLPAPPLATLALHGPWPNPIVTGAGASFELELATAGPATVAVYDAAGRRVREILARPLVAGRHALGWDGRDDRERPVPSGVYFLRAVTGAGQVTGRVAVVR
jgi:flagellar hook assembly protein FlgD